METKIKLESYINRHPFSIVFGLYIFSVIIRFLLVASPARMTIYYDEFRSYVIAESLATGRGLSQFNKESPFVEILYCLIIAPAFKFRANRILQFRIIAAINSLLICSGIFPTFFLAKRISKGKTKTALLFSSIYCILPDLTYSLLFYSENIQLPLTMCMIYAIYVCFEDVEQAVSKRYLINQFIIAFLFFLLYFSKMLSLIFPIALFVTILFEMLIKKVVVDNISCSKKRWIGYVFLIVVYVVFLSAMFRFFLGDRSFLRAEPMDPDALNSLAKYIYLFYGVIYYLLNATLASGIIPVILPAVNYKKLTHADKLFYAFLMIALGGLAIVNSYTCTLRENFPDLVPKANVRYACWFFLPIWMLYSNSIAEQLSMIKKRVLFALGTVIGLVYVAAYKGVTYSQADQTMLWYLIKFSEKQTRYICIFIFVLLVGGILLLFQSPKIHICLFGLIMCFLMIYDNIYTTKDRIQDHEISEQDYAEISAVESFIRKHSEDEFLYIFNDRTIDKYQKLGDTYLNYSNVTRLGLYELIENHQTDGSINLNYIDNDRLMQLDQIDYLILEHDWEAEYEERSINNAVESNYFDILRVVDGENKVIPPINFWWTIPIGTTKTFDVSKPHFLTQFDEDDIGGFVSNEDKQGSLLFGPYTTLPKGKYDITFMYSYDGKLEDGTKLGSVGVRGSVDLVSYDTGFYAGENSATITDVTINDFCTRFETLMITANSNIRVYAIKICRKE